MRKRSRKVLHWCVALALLAILAMSAAACGTIGASTATATPAAYTSDYIVKKGSITASISPTGEVYAPHQTSLYFDASNIPLTAIYVKVGQVVKAGEVLATIDTATLQGALDKAKANLLATEDALETAKNPYTEIQKRQAEAAVLQARSNLEAARKKLAELQSPSVAAAEKTLLTAEQNLPIARNKLAALKADPAPQLNIDNLQWKANEAEAHHGQQLSHASSPNPSEQQLDYEWLTRNLMLDAQEAVQRAKLQRQLDLLQAERDVLSAEDALADAKQALADLLAGASDPVALAQAKNAVSQAEYDLKKAENDLATIKAGADAEKVRLAQAKYEAAKAAYEEAQAALEGATMKAPFAGTIVAVNAKVGDLVSPNLAIFTLADLTDLRVLASIDETQIINVKAGQQVQVTFDALPGKRLQGEVLEVPLEGTLANNVVTYKVDIGLKDAAGLALKPGMTASLQIVTGSKRDALIVPSLAIIQNAEGIFVTLRETSGITTTTPVQIGLRSGTNVEIVRGLNEGDVVVLTYKSATTTQTQQRGQEFAPPPDVPVGPPPSGSSSGSSGGSTTRVGQ